MARKAQKTMIDRARRLRRDMTEAEAVLWRALRARRMAGLKFRRQVPVGPYIADFLCVEHKLIVEADGGQHAGSERDLSRNAWLAAEGYTVLRFWNHDVLGNLDGVLEVILAGRDGQDRRDPCAGQPSGDSPHHGSDGGSDGPRRRPAGEGTPALAPPRCTALGTAGDTHGTVTLSYNDRYRRRGLLITDAGEEILLDLAEAAELPDGGALILEDGRQILIRAAPEPLAEVRGPALARLAWHVGNRHTPCQVCEDRLLIQRDHVLEAMLAGLGAEIAHVEAPFRPEGGAYGHGRTHGHSHGHDPHADPNAHIPHRHDRAGEGA